jgi:AraC-like DNA-binding protein
VSPLDEALLDALVRLVALLRAPADVPVLAPLVRREVFYRLLAGAQGDRLRRVAAGDARARRIAAGLEWLRRHATRPVRMGDLAREVHMSPSTMHAWFKAVTAMTPLQYQKQLRLQEARRLLLAEDLDAAAASRRVGYESPTQFSREYRRMFGAPPMRDVERLRAAAGAAGAAPALALAAEAGAAA